MERAGSGVFVNRYRNRKYPDQSLRNDRSELDQYRRYQYCALGLRKIAMRTRQVTLRVTLPQKQRFLNYGRHTECDGYYKITASERATRSPGVFQSAARITAPSPQPSG